MYFYFLGLSYVFDISKFVFFDELSNIKLSTLTLIHSTVKHTQHSVTIMRLKHVIWHNNKKAVCKFIRTIGS